MVAELVFVGTELLLGQILNTNAQYLCRRLAEIGVDVFHETVVGDNQGRIVTALRQALGRAEVVITGGGLGPTLDDLTKEAVAEALGRPLHTDQAALNSIRAFFSARGRPMTPNNERQALVPEGGRAIPNPHGTAPGVLVEDGPRMVFMLPGPPNEFEPMVDQALVPLLRSRMPSGQVIVSRVLRLCGLGESEVETRIMDLIEGQGQVTIAPLASLGEVTLRLTTKAPSLEAGLDRIGPVEAEIRSRLDRYLYATGEETLPQAVARLLRERGLTVALAESCTGGLLGHQLTEVPGVSANLLLDVVAYANTAKVELLGVPAEVIERHGPVSEAVCAAMARGAMIRAGADIGVAVTGLAGPTGGTDLLPVGTVYVGLVSRDEGQAAVERHRFMGSRTAVKVRAVRQALVMLRDLLLFSEPGEA